VGSYLDGEGGLPHASVTQHHQLVQRHFARHGVGLSSERRLSGRSTSGVQELWGRGSEPRAWEEVKEMEDRRQGAGRLVGGRELTDNVVQTLPGHVGATSSCEGIREQLTSGTQLTRRAGFGGKVGEAGAVLGRGSSRKTCRGAKHRKTHSEHSCACCG
jgi:hypothetical protein